MVDSKCLEVHFGDEPSLTRQEFRDECDVNLILKKYRQVMGSDFLSQYPGFQGGQFGDFTGVVDYQTALDQVNRSRAAFEALPVNVRDRFNNDPGKFLDFVHDPKNRDEMNKLGLMKPRASVSEAVSDSKPKA